jgi:8-oxo-dGTP pyrophosphatase MutT (NUDIX family)
MFLRRPTGSPVTAPPHSSLEDLRALVARNLDAFDRRRPDEAGGRRAAVAITLTADEDERPAFLLTKRPDTINRHAGQWALPGGRVDHGESVTDAALRELHEELGLALAPDRVLGRLDDYATRSGFHIAPVVVWAGPHVTLDPDPGEVALAVRVPLREFDRADSPRWLDIDGARGPVVQLPVGDHGIHAPTAAILHQFHEVALLGRATRVAHFDEPPFAWR